MPGRGHVLLGARSEHHWIRSREIERYAAGQVKVLLAGRERERRRFCNLAGMRQWSEAIIGTLKSQLSLQRHSERAPAEVFTRVAQRLFAMAVCIWHDWSAGTTGQRSLPAYAH